MEQYFAFNINNKKFSEAKILSIEEYIKEANIIGDEQIEDTKCNFKENQDSSFCVKLFYHGEEENWPSTINWIPKSKFYESFSNLKEGAILKEATKLIESGSECIEYFRKFISEK